MQVSDAFDKKGISTLVQRMLEAAVTKAREVGTAFTIAFVDRGGVLKHPQRMDGASDPLSNSAIRPVGLS